MKMYFLRPENIKQLEDLFLIRKDGTYYEIASHNGFVDIMQYSERYKDVHLVTVKREKLNASLCLGFAEEF